MLPLSLRDKAQVFRFFGRARSQSGDPYGGLKTLEMAIPLALKAKYWDCLGKTRVELGISWLTVGDLPNSVDNFEAYLLDLPRYDTAKDYLGHVHYNLGLAYRRRRDHDRAIQHYIAAVEWFTERGHTLLTAETHQNLAWLYCLQGNRDMAEVEIEIAETFSEVCTSEFRVEQLVCRAFLHVLNKQVKRSAELIQEVLQPGRPGCTDSHRAHACWIGGKCLLAIFAFDDAQAYADFAIEYSLRSKDTGAMSLATALKAEIARRRRESDEAVG